MPEVMIHIGSVCSLKCPTCAYQFLDDDKLEEYANERMSLDHFKKVVDRYVNLGFDRINLTSIIGEPLQLPNFELYAEYVQEHPRIKEFTFFTSLTTNRSSMLVQILHMDKLKLVISVSGTEYEEFHQGTGTNLKMYGRFVDNITLLSRNANKIKAKLNFFIRYKAFFTESTMLANYITVLGKLDGNEITPFHLNGNWAGLVPDEITQRSNNWINRSEKKGICGYALNENTVLPDGRIVLCGAVDVEHKTILGNMNLQTLQDIYSEQGVYADILRKQSCNQYSGSCEGCSEHHPIDPEIRKSLEETLPWLKDI